MTTPRKRESPHRGGMCTAVRVREARRIALSRISLPEAARCVTNAVLTNGGRIRQGWKLGERYFETYHYPGALNFQSVIELDKKPEWAGGCEQWQG